MSRVVISNEQTATMEVDFMFRRKDMKGILPVERERWKWGEVKKQGNMQKRHRYVSYASFALPARLMTIYD